MQSHTSLEPLSEKQALRKACIARRNSLDPLARDTKSNLICTHAIALLERYAQDHLSSKAFGSPEQTPFKSAQSASNPLIALYYAMGSEVNLLPLAQWAYDHGWNVAYPVMLLPEYAKDNPSLPVMQFRRIEQADFRTAEHDVLSRPLRRWLPDDRALARFLPCSPDEINAVAIPLVAFDHDNQRLGYGGGCYDRLLTYLAPDTLQFGVAFEEQRVDHVPVGPFDRALPQVISA